MGDPFTLHDARRHGVSRSRLKASDLETRVFGIRAAAGAFDSLVMRCRMYALRLPNEAFFSHATAALLYGAPLPLSLELDHRLHVTVAAPMRAPHATGLIGHSREIREDDVRDVGGLRVSSPERTWCEMASMLQVPDLVAIGDHLIHHRAAWTTRDALFARLDRDRVSRSRRSKLALGMLDEHAESRRESLLRVILHQNGLASAEINRVVVHTTTGSDIRCDFTFTRPRVIVEYQGDYHRSKRQWRSDMTRRSRLEARGWYVIEVNADDLKDPRELVARIGQVLTRQRKLVALEAQVAQG